MLNSIYDWMDRNPVLAVMLIIMISVAAAGFAVVGIADLIQWWAAGYLTVSG